MCEKPQLHASSLNSLFRCAEQFRRRYIEGHKIAPGVALPLGSGVHQSIETNLTRKIETGKLADLEEVRAVAADYVKSEWATGEIALTPEEKAQGEKIVRAKTIDQAVQLATVHHQGVAPQLAPAAVEFDWVIECDGYPVDIAGTWDLIERPNDHLWVTDWKTAVKAPTQANIDNDFQMTTYDLAARIVHGEKPSNLRFGYLIKTKAGRFQWFRTTRSKGDIDVFMRRFEVAIKAIEAGIFLPASDKGWWCSPKMCGYWDSCPYVRARTRPKT